MKRGLNILKEYGCAGPGAAQGPGKDLSSREGVNHSGEEDATSWSARPSSGKHQENKRRVFRLPCKSKKRLPTAVGLATHVLPETETQPSPLGPRPPAPSHHRAELQPLPSPTGDLKLPPANSRKSHTPLLCSKQDPKSTGGIHPPGPEEDRQQHLFEIKCLD